VSRAPQRFGDSRLGESVLAVWQAVTDSIPVSRTSVYAAQIRYLGWLNKSPRRYQDNWAGNSSEIQVVVGRRTILNDASVGGVDDQHVGLGPAGDFGWD
jgi:hypothetical protein